MPYLNETGLAHFWAKIKAYADSLKTLPPGGTTGQALVKESNEDGDAGWAGVILSDDIKSAKVLTEAEYNALSEKVSTVLYVIPEEEAVAAASEPAFEEPGLMDEPSAELDGPGAMDEPVFDISEEI